MNLHEIKQPIPEWLLDLTREWEHDYAGEYPLRYHAETDYLEYQHKGEWYDFGTGIRQDWSAKGKRHRYPAHPEIVAMLP